MVEKVSLGVYYATKLSRDPKRSNGHRTLTHTIPFTVLVGWGTTTLCARYGKWAVIGILFFMIGLALRGLFDEWAERAGWVIVTLVSAGAASFTAANLPGDRGYPMIGLAVGVGCFVHIIGDMITRAGVPILWPIPIKRRMWTPISLPDSIALRAGGKTEIVVVRTALTVVSVLAAVGLVAPSVLQKFNLDL